MNRMEFLTELERLLSGMPEEERQAAVQYYADYLADAGEENEAEAIRELGSPEKVAESIKADYYGTEFDESRFDCKNYMEKYGQRSSDERAGSSGYRSSAGYTGSADAQGSGTESTAKDPGSAEKKAPWTDRRVKIILIVLILLAVWPVSLGVGCAVLGIAVGIVAFFAALVLAALCIMFAGGVLAVTGVALLVIPPAGMIVAGIGILLFVLGLIGAAGSVKLCMVVYPAMLRGFVDLCRKPFHGKAVS